MFRAGFLADGDVLTTAPDGVRRHRGADLKLMRVLAGRNVRWFDLRAVSCSFRAGAGRVGPSNAARTAATCGKSRGAVLLRNRD